MASPALLLPLPVLALSLLGSAGGLATNLTASFEPVHFSDANTVLKYNSSTKFNALGMGHLYTVTNFFIDLVVNKDLLPEASKKYVISLLSESLDVYLGNARFDFRPEEVQWEQLKPIVTHQIGIVAIVVVGLLFAILMPICGIVLCCCRCCCVSKRPRTEKHRDGCRRLLLGSVLSGITIILLFGVVCAFVTNAYMENGIQALPSKLSTALDDAQLYLSNTKSELDTILVTNFAELEVTLNKALNNCGKLVTNELEEASQAVVLANLTALVGGLPVVREELQTTKSLTQQLQANAVQLRSELDDIRSDLERLLMQCKTTKACAETLSSKNIKNLNTTGDFSRFLDRYFPKLPNITDSIASVEELLRRGIEDDVKKGKEAFEAVQNNISETVNRSIPEIQNNMHEAGEAVKAKAEQIKDMITNLDNGIKQHGRSFIKTTISPGIKNYSHFRYYPDVTVSSVLLAILFCLSMGLFYGFCGKRPDSVYGDDCCNKGTGANLLIIGIWLMFVFSSLLMIITIFHFLVGIVVQRTACDTFRNPEKSQLFPFLEERINIGSLYSSHSRTNITLLSIIQSCHRNNSIYDVLQVAEIVNITEISQYSDKFRIKDKILALKSLIKINNRSIVILDDKAKKDLYDLQQSPLNMINFTEFSLVLEQAIVAVDLLDLAQTLNHTADQLSENAWTTNNKNVQDSLRRDALRLERLQYGLVANMSKKVKLLQDTTSSLQEHLKFNHSSLQAAIQSLIQEATEAQLYLNKNGPAKLKELSNKVIDGFLKYVMDYQNHVVNFTLNDLGRCGPISQAYNASIIASCDEILKPWNGFWTSIGWSLLLFIPAIIFSMKLVDLYRKMDPYQGPIAESEYLYDAYADRDNIPLANGPDKKNHHRRYNETYDNSCGYAGDYSAHLGRGDRNRDRTGAGYNQEELRFADMAPKHWDFANGAMPRYHSPPLSTEYERPPPYYYPGPGDSSRR